MSNLDAMKTSCHQALEAAGQAAVWQSSYCEVVDPASVLGLVAQLESQIGDDLTAERAAFVNLVRDLIGYIKLSTGDRPDPVREDLLLQAKDLITELERGSAAALARQSGRVGG